MGVVPLVSAAVVYDLTDGTRRRPGPRRVTRRARPHAPRCRSVARSGPAPALPSGSCSAASGPTRGGVGYAATVLADGATIAAIAVANAFGDVIGRDGELLGAPA